MLYIIGNGGLAREIWDYEAAPRVFVSKGQEEYLRKHAKVICGIGIPDVRKEVITRLRTTRPDLEWVDGDYGYVSGYSAVGLGFVGCPASYVTSGAQVGVFCLLNIGAVISHDAVVGDFCVLSPGAKVNGWAKLGDNVFMGTNSVVIPSVSVCSNVIIGAGAVVTKDIIEPGTYVGMPARCTTCQ